MAVDYAAYAGNFKPVKYEPPSMANTLAIEDLKTKRADETRVKNTLASSMTDDGGIDYERAGNTFLTAGDTTRGLPLLTEARARTTAAATDAERNRKIQSDAMGGLADLIDITNGMEEHSGVDAAKAVWTQGIGVLADRYPGMARLAQGFDTRKEIYPLAKSVASGKPGEGWEITPQGEWVTKGNKPAEPPKQTTRDVTYVGADAGKDGRDLKVTETYNPKTGAYDTDGWAKRFEDKTAASPKYVSVQLPGKGAGIASVREDDPGLQGMLDHGGVIVTTPSSNSDKGADNLRAAWDPDKKAAVFATDAEIKDKGYQPLPTGMKVVSDGHGGLEITTGTAGGTELTRATETAIEGALNIATDARRQLHSIATSFQPQFQQFAPRAATIWTAIKEKAGFQPTPEDQKLLADFTTFRRRSVENVNKYIHDMTGAAMGVQEAARLMKAVPVAGVGVFDGDSPTEFQTKLGDVLHQTDLAIARLNYVRRSGTFNIDPNKLETELPLDKMDDIMNARAGEIRAQLKGDLPNLTPDQLNQVIAGALATEFGLAVGPPETGGGGQAKVGGGAGNDTFTGGMDNAAPAAMDPQQRAGLAVEQPPADTAPVVVGLKAGERLRKPIQNKDGTYSTEYTVTVQDDRLNGGKYTVIPSIFGGKFVSPEAATDIIVAAQGKDPETGAVLKSFDDLDAAETYANARHEALDQMYGGNFKNATAVWQRSNAPLSTATSPIRSAIGGIDTLPNGRPMDAPLATGPMDGARAVRADVAAPPQTVESFRMIYGDGITNVLAKAIRNGLNARQSNGYFDLGGKRIPAGDVIAFADALRATPEGR